MVQDIEHLSTSEEGLVTTLCKQLAKAWNKPSILSDLRLINSTSSAKSLLDLIGTCGYEIIEDDSRWNLHPGFMKDVIGGMTPDIVLRSVLSGENRVYIEVKKTRRLGYKKYDSQVIRYFLHLLATTRTKPIRAQVDIRRAIIVAAPPAWFEDRHNSEPWGYFLERYTDLASSFDITLAEIRLDSKLVTSVFPI